MTDGIRPAENVQRNAAKDTEVTMFLKVKMLVMVNSSCKIIIKNKLATVQEKRGSTIAIVSPG